jgi:2-oxoglutarate ferredoxin oxidoreductase subunit alpha
LNKGYQEADKHYNYNETEADQKKKEILIDGTDAIALGAITAGVKFYTAYPMSPSTGIMNYIAGKQKDLGIVVEQAESEIGAINMALGASFGGVRSMTGTSGGGFALMAEGMGLAGVTETPLVVAEIQRPGPATGLPTRSEQGDLLFVINVSQGEFPLMVISPRDQEDAFYQTFRAFNLAEKYQIPVVILGDQFLADTAKTMEEFNFDRLNIKRYILSEEEKNKEYNRYEITDDGISPRGYPGQIAEGVVLADSDEHNQACHNNQIYGLTKGQASPTTGKKW